MKLAWLPATAVIALLSILASPTGGLRCYCNHCVGKDYCDVSPGGVCFSQVHYDPTQDGEVIRIHDCVGGLDSPVCLYKESDGHRTECCNGTDYCNRDLLPTLPGSVQEPDASEPKPMEPRTGGNSTVPTATPNTPAPNSKCECTPGTPNCNKKKRCKLQSSCYTTLNKLGSTITYEKGCSMKQQQCQEMRSRNTQHFCCNTHLCNAGKPNWETTVATPTSTSSTPGTASATSGDPSTTFAPPNLDSDSTPSTQPPTEDKSSTIGPITFTEPETGFRCHCSSCTGKKECKAHFACGLYNDTTHGLTSICVQDTQTCGVVSNVHSIVVSCCFGNFCNRLPEENVPNGEGCSDDEDFDCTTGSGDTTPTTGTAATSNPSSSSGSTSTTPTPTIKSITDDEDGSDHVYVILIVIVSVCLLAILILGVICAFMVYLYHTSQSARSELPVHTIVVKDPIDCKPPQL